MFFNAKFLVLVAFIFGLVAACSDTEVRDVDAESLTEQDAATDAEMSLPRRTFVEDELTPEEQKRAKDARVYFRVLGVSQMLPSSDLTSYWRSAAFIADNLSYSVALRRITIQVHGEQILADTREFIHSVEFIDACQLRREANGVLISVTASQERDALLFDVDSVLLASLHDQAFQLYCAYRLPAYVSHPVEVRFRVPFEGAETNPDVVVVGTRFQDSPVISLLPPVKE